MSKEEELEVIEPEKSTPLEKALIPFEVEEIPEEAMKLIEYGLDASVIKEFLKRFEGKALLYQDKLTNAFFDFYLQNLVSVEDLEELKSQGIRGLFREKQIDTLMTFKIPEVIKDNNMGFLQIQDYERLVKENEDLRVKLRLMKEAQELEKSLIDLEYKTLAIRMYEIMNSKMMFLKLETVIEIIERDFKKDSKFIISTLKDINKHFIESLSKEDLYIIEQVRDLR